MKNSPLSFLKNGEPIGLRLNTFRKKDADNTSVDIAYDDVFKDEVRKSLGKQDFSSEELGFYVGDIVQKATHGIDGYSVVVEIENSGVK